MDWLLRKSSIILESIGQLSTAWWLSTERILLYLDNWEISPIWDSFESMYLVDLLVK
jgi:hypothetical protein